MKILSYKVIRHDDGAAGDDVVDADYWEVKN